MKLLRALVLALLAFAFAPAPATAQDPAPPVAAPRQADVDELLRLLSDPQIVAWLKQNAAGAAAEETPPHSFRAEIEARMAHARARIVELARAWSNFPLVPQVLFDTWRAELSKAEALRSLIYVIIFLFIGGGLEWLYWQYLHPTLLRIENRPPSSLWKRLGGASARLGLQVAGLAIFAIGSVGAFLTFGWPPFLERVVVNLLLVAIGVRALAMASRFVLAPRSPALRLVPLDNAMARRVHRWHLAVAFVLLASLLTADTLAMLAGSRSGSPEAASAALAVSVALGAFTTLMLVVMVWALARALARSRARDPRQRRRLEPLISLLLPIAQTAIIVTAFVLWVFDSRALMWTVLVVGLFTPAAHVLRVMVDHFFDRMAEPAGLPAPVSPPAAPEAGIEGAIPAHAPPPVPARGSIYRPIVARLARFALAAVALVVLAAAWGTNIFELSESPSLAGRFAKIAIDIVAALLIADLIWVWGKTAIDRRLSAYVPPPPGEPPGPEARMATLLPLLRNMLLVAVVTLVGLTVLSSLGVNIAPLIAGAGIVGIAIGFGTQSLVRDIVSGIFFLLDDAFRVGEYIEMGSLRGTVESMSIRSMRVRHHRGAVHTIPFGELKSLTNYSRDWVIMKLEFRVPFDTDIKLVKKLVKQIGAELQADPNYGAYFLEPLKSQGVRKMEEFNMVVGVKFMAKPGAQWVIRRDAYQKLRDAFDKHGLSFAQRNVKVEVLSEQPLSDDVRRAVTGAAQDAMERRAASAPPADEP